ncbi:MAG: toll/interleukin-1 receptor domain-containing protein [Pseudomonadota bacterium]
MFISYAHADESQRKRLEVHLAPLRREGLCLPWHDRMIEPGATWAGEIDRNLAEADIVLLLVSADFIASDYCYEKELAWALTRHAHGEAGVIPIIVAPVDFGKTPFAKLQALPRDAKPVSTWDRPEEAWLDVAKGLRRVVEALRQTWTAK